MDSDRILLRADWIEVKAVEGFARIRLDWIWTVGGGRWKACLRLH